MASITDVSLNWGLYYNLDNSGSDGIVTITTTNLDGSNVFITLDGNSSGSVAISNNSANITIDDASFSALSSGTSYTINATIVEDTDISNSETFTYDIIAPVLTVTGDASITIEKGATYNDQGATSDGGETVTTSGSVDTNTVGTYTLTYSATDAAGNTGTATRTVNVVDTTAPDYDVTEPIGTFVFNITTPIANRIIDKRPTLVINTDEAGTLRTNIATGFNSGASLSVTVGDNTIELAELQYGTYSGKTLTLTDSANNSKTVTIPTFEILEPELTVTSGVRLKRI